jgi:hypothetical protein
MKKRVVIFSLMIVVALMSLMPTAAYAGNNDWRANSGTTDFSGAGMIYVTYMPDPVINRNIWRYNGEIAEGILQQCNWDLLAGTVFWSNHNSVVRVDEQGNAFGIMMGTFSLARPDGSGVLTGTFSGRISGNLATGIISDAGMWMSTSGSGVFAGTRAWGKWSADLCPGLIPGTNYVTLLGPLSWEGKYWTPSKRPDTGRWKFW